MMHRSVVLDAEEKSIKESVGMLLLLREKSKSLTTFRRAVSAPSQGRYAG